jgi:hypothetical protein
MSIAGVGNAGVCGVCAMGEAEVVELGLEAGEAEVVELGLEAGEGGMPVVV